MGFYLKKSINLGPLKLNLSNSGIGISTGTKGLRTGVDSKGRMYVSGGKGVLRYKKYLSTKKGAASEGESGIWKTIAIFLFLALILTTIYFIKPDLIDEIIRLLLKNLL